MKYCLAIPILHGDDAVDANRTMWMNVQLKSTCKHIHSMTFGTSTNLITTKATHWRALTNVARVILCQDQFTTMYENDVNDQI